MNTVILIGRLTRDPELRYTAQTQNAMCTFTLAVDRGYTRQQRQEREAQGQQTADFIRVTCWGKTAELAGNYLQKGLRTGVQGRIQTGSYENQQGQRVYTTDVVCERLEFIDWPDTPRSQGQGGYGDFNQDFNQDPSFNQGGSFGQGGQHKQNDPGFSDDDDDFMPFDDDSKIPF